MTIVSWEFESPSLHFHKRLVCGNSSVGRARPCQGRGREFESRFPLKIFRNIFCPGGGMVDALVSGASVERRAGSSPVLGTENVFCIIRRDGGIGRRATLRG